MNKVIQTRPVFVEANPHLKDAHLRAQRAMFGAARLANLPTKDEAKDDMIEGINAAFNYRGSQRLISRKQMTIEEMRAVTVAIEAGLFSDDWTWGYDFGITVSTHTVQAEVAHIELRDRITGEVRSEFHTATINAVTFNDARAFNRLVNA